MAIETGDHIKKERLNNRIWLLFYFVVLILVYAAQFSAPAKGVAFDLVNRSIDPPLRNILNGYLGTFFYFKYIGGIIWIILPAAFVLFLRKRVSWANNHLLWIIPVVIMVLFIALKANINYRYHLTVFPLFTCIAFWFLALIFKEEHIRNNVFKGVIVLQILNSLLFTVVDFYPRYKDRLAGSVKGSSKASGVFEYVEKHLGIDDKVYVDNLPEFFVHTRQTGLFGWSGNREYFDVHGKHAFPVDIGSNSLRRMLADTLHCNYFFVHENLKQYRGGFQDFLDEQTTCVYADSSGYRLHALIPE